MMRRLSWIAATLVVMLCAGQALAQSSWPADKIAGSLDLGTGTIRGDIFGNTETSATVTMVDADIHGVWHVAAPTGAQQWDMVNAVAGANFCILITTAQTISMNPDTGDKIVVPTSLFTPALGVDDELDSGGTLGELACFWSYTNDEWFLLGFRGPWADGGPT